MRQMVCSAYMYYALYYFSSSVGQNRIVFEHQIRPVRYIITSVPFAFVWFYIIVLFERFLLRFLYLNVSCRRRHGLSSALQRGCLVLCFFIKFMPALVQLKNREPQVISGVCEWEEMEMWED